MFVLRHGFMWKVDNWIVGSAHEAIHAGRFYAAFGIPRRIAQTKSLNPSSPRALFAQLVMPNCGVSHEKI